MVISEAAKASGVSAKMARYYESIGLMPLRPGPGADTGPMDRARSRRSASFAGREGINPSFVAWLASGDLSPCRILVPARAAARNPPPCSKRASTSWHSTWPIRRRLPGSPSRRRPRHQGDVTTWMPDKAFDAVYDQTCLCALPPELWVGYEAQLRRWLKPGGRLFILFMQTGREGGPPFDCPLLDMRSLFSAWTWPDTLAEDVAHGLGTVEQPAALVRRDTLG